jgi:hypothetical protein
MKKLNVILTFSGAADKVYTCEGVDERSLDEIWTACYAALGFMTALSKVTALMEAGLGVEDVTGREDLRLVVQVDYDKKGDKHNDATFNWYKMNATQTDFMLASFENQFKQAGIKWH